MSLNNGDKERGVSQLEKAKLRLKSAPVDYTYSEARSLLKKIGYMEYSKGKNSGSRVKFYRAEDDSVILLHKPHPGDQMSPGAVDELKTMLERSGDL